MPSIIAEIGDVIERHLIDIGMLASDEPDEHQRRLIEEKKAELRGENPGSTVIPGGTLSTEPATAAATRSPGWRAPRCAPSAATRRWVMRDGCQTCMNCGDSKCG